ncbi:14838_t:CDS:1, partial [Cetraspora pellucida]
AQKTKYYLIKKTKKHEEKIKIPFETECNNTDPEMLEIFYLSQGDYNIKYNEEKNFHLKFIEGNKYSVWKDSDIVEIYH